MDEELQSILRGVPFSTRLKLQSLKTYFNDFEVDDSKHPWAQLRQMATAEEMVAHFVEDLSSKRSRMASNVECSSLRASMDLLVKCTH